MHASGIIILVAGGSTFVNEWMQTKNIDWKVPIATALAAAGMEGLAALDEKAALSISVMALIAAATTRFGNPPKSTIDMINDIFQNPGPVKAQATATKLPASKGSSKP